MGNDVETDDLMCELEQQNKSIQATLDSAPDG